MVRDDVLAHLKLLSAATDLPLNADFENGFADAPDGVAANVTRAVEAALELGVADATDRRPSRVDREARLHAAARRVPRALPPPSPRPALRSTLRPASPARTRSAPP